MERAIVSRTGHDHLLTEGDDRPLEGWGGVLHPVQDSKDGVLLD